MKKFLLALSFALVAAAAARAQVLRANIESSTVPMGEAFNLNLSYDGKDGANLQPDLSVLQKDFSIYSTSSSSQISYVNGQSSEQRDWDIGLLPKREGEVEIPAISVGKYKTQPLKLKVLPAGSAVAAQPQSGNVQNDNQLAETVKFGVDLAVDLKQPYLQQEINAVLTIDDKVGLQLTDEPQFVNAENWVIKQLKKPELIQQNGERKFKFYYAMFPQTSGKQTIPAAKISGFYMGFDKKLGHPLLEQGVNSLFQLMSVDFDEMFGTQKPVELYTKPIEIDVLPKPENYAANWWLPADGVKIKAIWNEKKPLFKVGETVARQVILLAAGTAETQLPEFDFTDSASFKVYPENPQLESQMYDNKLIAQSITRVVYIPQQGGEQVLPEIRVPWFNVKTKKMEEAIVPAEKIFVEGVAAAEQPAENAKQPDNPLIEAEQLAKPVKNEGAAETTAAVSPLMLSTGLVAAFLAGLLFSLLLMRRPQKNNEKKCQTVGNMFAVLHKNLAAKDYRALRDNLILWGNEIYKKSNINNLQDLAVAVGDKNFAEQMQKINNILYGGEKTDIDAALILDTVKSCKHNQSKAAENEPLPKLYK